MDTIKVKPFLKWAGGKGQLLAEIKQYYPFDNTNIVRYVEPFVGGGAVLFDVLSNYPKLEYVYISDINKELINTYLVIKNDLAALLPKLQSLQDEFWNLGTDERKLYYLGKRELFNKLKCGASAATAVDRAALMIFLNKTCFNGLYRVNKSGAFNVPVGSYKKPLICDRDNLTMASRLLQKVDIVCADYHEAISVIDANTFVYIDPPYRPLSTTSSFVAYNENCFDDAAQVELAQFVDKITSLKAKVVVSNSDPQNVDEADDFFINIYGAYKICKVNATRMINSKASARGKINELLISNMN